jgi:serine/threonine protein kinase
MRLIEGQLIHGRYRLDSRIAKGGMGEVWKGYDIELGRTVAIKALRSDLANGPTRLARLRAEAHNSANLAHPNIAALFEYYEHDGMGFLIMEYVPSKSLAQIYKKVGKMSPERLLPILIQAARGLYVAHRHGVIHRDVKPGNIMVSSNGDVKITDFGVSYSTNQAQITQSGMVVGTAQYISPEQAQGEKATPQSDIYSLGIVAYEGLAGHRPFTGATPVDIAAAQVNDPVPPLPDDIDPQLRDYVMKMLSKDPAKRPRSALDVSRQLSAIERRILAEDTGKIGSATTETALPQPTHTPAHASSSVPEPPLDSFGFPASPFVSDDSPTTNHPRTQWKAVDASSLPSAVPVPDSLAQLSERAFEHSQVHAPTFQPEHTDHVSHMARGVHAQTDRHAPLHAEKSEKSKNHARRRIVRSAPHSVRNILHLASDQYSHFEHTSLREQRHNGIRNVINNVTHNSNTSAQTTDNQGRRRLE